MLRSRRDFAAFEGGSRSRAHPLLLVRYRRNEAEVTRYGLSTGRRLGTAVVRNRTRRRLREALRRIDARVAPGWDVLVVARQASATASHVELTQTLERLMGAAGLMEGTARER